jgi:hypothetical protein
MSAKNKFGPDISTAQRDQLEVAGMTPRQIDDAVSALRIRHPEGFTTQAILEYQLISRWLPLKR